MAIKVLKLLCAVLATAAVLLCGCTKRNAPNPPELHFQADFTADYHGIHPAGSLTRTRQGVCTMTFTAPQTLAGLQICCKDGEIALSREEAAATADEPYLPDDSFPMLLCALLQDAADNTAPDGNTYPISFPSGDGTLTVDDRRLPVGAEIPAAEFAVSFSHCEPVD